MQSTDSKTLVIERAKEIFKVHGYKKTTIDDIAKACHSSKGLIYHYFNSKEEIFKIVVETELNQFLSELKNKLNNQDNVRDKFVYFFKEVNLWLTNTASINHKIVYEVFDYIDIIKNEIEDIHNKTIDILKSIIKEGIEKKDFIQNESIEKTAISLLQMIMGLIYTPMGQVLNIVTNETDIYRFVDIIYYGLEKR